MPRQPLASRCTPCASRALDLSEFVAVTGGAILARVSLSVCEETNDGNHARGRIREDGRDEGRGATVSAPKVAVFYATREGHGARVANRVADVLRRRGFDPCVENVRTLTKDHAIDPYRGAILIASVHAGEHEPEMVAFVRNESAWLKRVPSAFLSVSLTEATVEDVHASPAVREKARADVQATMDRFFTETGWRPTEARAVAGALPYTHYGFFKRVLMKLIVAKTHGPTDTSIDHDFTNWPELETFVEVFLGEVTYAVSEMSKTEPNAVALH